MRNKANWHDILVYSLSEAQHLAALEICQSLDVELGELRYWDTNPLLDALAGPDAQYLVDQWQQLPGYSKKLMAVLASVFQAQLHDRVDGPDRDGRDKGLRRHWYSWFKVDFAQPYSVALGEDLQDTRWGLNWAGLLSKTYGELVDEFNVTYHDLWVKDSSRMIKQFWQELYPGANIVLAVEKDSLHGDFEELAQRLGARVLLSGKGKPSKASIEKMLRDHFGFGTEAWSYEEQDYVDGFRVDREHPLIVLTLTDFDYDGHSVIAPAFADQLRRYSPYVRTARIGITPQQLQQVDVDGRQLRIQDKMYELKLTHTGYIDWATDYAIFAATCDHCGTTMLQVSTEFLPDRGCCSSPSYSLVVAKRNGNTPHGLEVEAMPTSAYYSLAVDALLSVLDWDNIISEMRDDCKASAEDAADSILRNIIAAENESYGQLLEEIRRLENLKLEFEYDARQKLFEFAEPHISDFRDEEDDPTVDQFKDHVTGGARISFEDVFRPFSATLRTNKLVTWITEEDDDGMIIVDDLKNEQIDWRQDSDD